MGEESRISRTSMGEESRINKTSMGEARQTSRRSFTDQGSCPLYSDNSVRRLTIGSIGRSATIGNSGAQASQERRESFRRTISEARVDTEDVDCSIEFEIEDLSSPVLERPTTLPELNSRPVSRMMERLSPLEGDLERQKRKRATAIVTSGALTFMVLAAALVTASFLMSPVIEDVFGKQS